MPYIACMPQIRFLGCQDTVAGDDGFVALSQSRSIECIWGRRCHNLQARGFAALARMPALRGLSVSCKNVADEGVAELPGFPALRELMPMDVPDAGYRHIAALGGARVADSDVLPREDGCRDESHRSTAATQLLFRQLHAHHGPHAGADLAHDFTQADHAGRVRGGHKQRPGARCPASPLAGVAGIWTADHSEYRERFPRTGLRAVLVLMVRRLGDDGIC
jgi:hypothetical protein